MATATENALLPGVPDLRGLEATMARRGYDPATFARIMDEQLGAGWEGTHGDVLLRDVAEAIADLQKRAPRDVVNAAGVEISPYFWLGEAARLEGVATVYGVTAAKFRLRPGCFGEAIRLAANREVEVRCEHRSAVSQLVGHVTKLYDAVEPEGKVLRFEAVLHSVILAEDIAEQLFDRFLKGERIGISVGVASLGENGTRVRQDGTKDYLNAQLVELSLVDRPACPEARVTSFQWVGRHLTQEREWRWRRALARGPAPRSVNRRGSEPYIMDAQSGRLISPRQTTPTSSPILRERERLEFRYSAWRSLLSGTEWRNFIDAELASSGRLG